MAAVQGLLRRRPVGAYNYTTLNLSARAQFRSWFDRLTTNGKQGLTTNGVDSGLTRRGV